MNEVEFKRPVRVLVTAEGCALPPRMAKSRYKVEPVIVFFREDGWSLGADKDLEAAAYALWPQKWIAYQRKGKDIEHIGKYRKEQRQ